MAKIYLIRHAETLGNNAGRFQGNSDTQISPHGITQLEKLRERFAGVDIKHIYTSPLKRAQLTAEYIRAGREIPVTDAPDLREINLGAWEGEEYDSVDERWPEEKQLWRNTPHLFAAPGGESMQQVFDRAVCFISRTAREHPAGEAIALVSHGGTIRNIWAWLNGGIHMLNDMPWVKNTSVSCFSINGADRQVHLINDASHLEE